MKIKKHIAISESGVIYNGATGDSFSVNPIAGDILVMIKSGKDESAIKEAIIEKYDVDAERLDADLYDYLTHLRQLNLLEANE